MMSDGVAAPLVFSALCIWILIFLNMSSTFRYYAKFSFYFSYVTILCVFLLPIMIFRGRTVANMRLGAMFVKPLQFIFGLPVKVIGRENLPENSDAAVCLCNHQSILDFLVMCELVPILHNVSFVGKKALMYCGSFGPASYLVDTFYIDRSNTAKSREDLNANMDRVIKEKTKLWIFPEGTRNSKPTLLPFKKGAFHLAINSKLPILPIVIRSYDNVLDHTNKTLEKGFLTVQILPPIPTDTLTIEDVDKLAERSREKMLEAYVELSKSDKNIDNMEKKVL